MTAAATASVLDDRPFPWIIALEIDPDSEIGRALKETGGDVMFCSSLNEIRQSDFHLLVCDSMPSGAVSNDLDVLQFLEVKEWRRLTSYTMGANRFTLTEGDRASSFTVCANDTARSLDHLIKSTVLANVERASEYQVIREREAAPPTVNSVPQPTSTFTPLVSEERGHPLGGYVTNTAGRQWWLMPGQTNNRALWVRAVFEIWKGRRPEIFPVDALEAEDTWMTLAERKAHDEIRHHGVQTSKLLADRENELEKLKDAAQAMTEVAREKEKRLLFSTGDDLVEAVMDALIRIGFEVTDADETAAANNSAKREDLQVRIASEDGWICLVEVKGKNRAAATSDLAQLAKAGAFYEARTGHKPDAEWYIVNASRQQSPSARPVPLNTSRADVDYYAKEDNAAVIDTRELFILLREVESKSIDPAAAQESLRLARGIYTSPRGTDLVPEF